MLLARRRSTAAHANDRPDGLGVIWAIAGVLLLLLAVLGGIKAVWLQDVSAVERDLLRAGLAAQAAAFRAALVRAFEETHASDLTPARVDQLLVRTFGQQTAYIVTITRRGPSGELIYTSDAKTAARASSSRRPLSGAQLDDVTIDVRHRLGTIDDVIRNRNRRDLGLSLAVLMLLGASALLTLASARRRDRLARQQMEFVAAVSHELRTPLAAVCSAGENLADGIVHPDERVRAYGAIIAREGSRLADMVERVLEYAGIMSGGAARPAVAIDPARLLMETLNDVGLRGAARDRQVHIDLDVDNRRAGTPPAILGDPDELRAAWLNVIGNAVKYSRPGGQVTVWLRADAQVSLVVTDRGIGIDEDELPRVFDPFFRGRRAVQAQIRGTGVGLSVVRRAVARHRGTVQVESRAGEGTTVTIVLPAEADAVDRADPANAAEATDALDRQGAW